MLGAVVDSVAPGFERELLPSEVVDHIRRDVGHEPLAQPQAASPGVPQLYSDWCALDSDESVMGSLLTLNARLLFYEEGGQAG